MGLYRPARQRPVGDHFAGRSDPPLPDEGAIGEFSSAAVIGATGGLTNHTAGSVRWPDVVGNLRIDQSWGSAQIMAAAHDVMADYYVGSPVTAGTTEWNGHPGDEVGWAVGGGIKVNLPWWQG